MKLKHAAGLLAALPLFLLTACATTPALSFTANWHSNTNNSNVLSGTDERLTYAVTFAPASTTANFRVEYDEGTYTTKLESVNIAQAAGNPVGYFYETVLTVTGRYYVNGQRGADFTDSVISKVWFLGVRDDLRPVQSEKTILCSAPNLTATGTSNAFVTYNYRYSMAYNADLSKVTYTYEDLKENTAPKETTYKLGGQGTYLDNEQMLFALRGLAMDSTFSFRTFDSVTLSQRTVTSFATPTDEKYAAEFSMTVAGGEATNVTGKVDSARFSIGFDGDNPGFSQTYEYARCKNTEMNTYRNVLLHMETQAIGSLGTFSYDLKEAIFNN